MPRACQHQLRRPSLASTLSRALLAAAARQRELVETAGQPFHTPKNLAMALMVDAAEMAEIFQWMTPEASVKAREDAQLKARIGAEGGGCAAVAAVGGRPQPD